MARWLLFRFYMRNLTNYVWDEIFNSSELPYNWRDADNSLNLELDVPGFGKGEIEVKTKENVISINGKPNENSQRRNFNLSFKMPSYVNPAETKAELQNGVLVVSVPKKEIAVAKEIDVKIS